MGEKVSVVIPVHNGAKYLRKTISGILAQSYKNIEVILVENASTDNSLDVCNNLKEIDRRVKVLESKNKGTSLARKKGVEFAQGKYIIFSDQDDSYANTDAIQGMYEAIVEDDVQICQFGHYKKYVFGLTKKITKTQDIQKYSREELMSDEIKGILGQGGSRFDTVVWNKIYDAEILKLAVRNINDPLFFAEDEYLNIYAFFNEDVKKVSVRKEAYYVWSVGIGFSSSTDGNEALFRDYEIVKPASIKFLSDNACKEELKFNCHLESIYFFRCIIRELILNGKSKNEVIDKINEFNNLEFVKTAKKYFTNCSNENIYEELQFLTSDYSADEYYEYCLLSCKHLTLKEKFMRYARDVSRHK